MDLRGGGSGGGGNKVIQMDWCMPDVRENETASSPQDDESLPCGLFTSVNHRGNRAKLPPPTDADALLARELNELSVEEREKIMESIHGVDESILDETLPGLVDQKLAELEGVLGDIKKNTVYEKVAFLAPSYVKDREFLMMFLRSDQFDANKAARRVINYFDSKKILFGEEKLCKRITLDDLGEDDMAALMSGGFIYLDAYDVSGRRLVLVSSKWAIFKTWQSHLRAAWYSIESALLEDVETQKRGVVNVFYNVDLGQTEQSYFDVWTRAKRIIDDSLPYRSKATHYCYNNPLLHPALSLLQMIMGKENRIRFKTHYGSTMECMYALKGFGVPVDKIPIDHQGNLKPNVTRDYVESRRRVESELKKQPEGLIMYPGPNDVLLGKGKVSLHAFWSVGEIFIDTYVSSTNSFFSEAIPRVQRKSKTCRHCPVQRSALCQREQVRQDMYFDRYC